MTDTYANKFTCGLFIIIIALTLHCTQLNAEEPTKAEDCFHSQLDSYIRYMPSRDVDAMSGKIEIIESDVEYSCEFKAFDKLPVKFSLDNKYIDINDTVGVSLPSHLVGLITDVETTVPFFNFNKDLFLRLGVSPSFYADDWDFPASSFRIPVRSFLIYKPSDTWTLLAGVAVYPDFENEVLPILGLIYKPNDRLAFNLIPKRPNVSFNLNQRVTLFAEGGGSLNTEFEVTRDDTKNTPLRYKETHLGAGIKFKLNPYIQSSVTAGGVFNRSLKYRDNQGKVNIKDGLYTEFRMEAKF